MSQATSNYIGFYCEDAGCTLRTEAGKMLKEHPLMEQDSEALLRLVTRGIADKTALTVLSQHGTSTFAELRASHAYAVLVERKGGDDRIVMRYNKAGVTPDGQPAAVPDGVKVQPDAADPRFELWTSTRSVEARAEEERRREAWRGEMRNRGEKREYNDLTADIRGRELLQAKSEAFSLYSQQMSIGMNVIVSLLTAVAVGYALGHHLFGHHNIHAGWIGGLSFGITLMTVEAYFVISRVSRADAAMSAKMKAANLQPTLPPASADTTTAAASAEASQHGGTQAEQTVPIPGSDGGIHDVQGLRQRKTGAGR